MRGNLETLFDFDDILIEPAKLTKINTRKSVYPRTKNGFLPIMTAPMDTVINEYNYNLFQSVGIHPVLPRVPNPNENYVSSDVVLSYSLDDFERIFLQGNPKATYGVPMLALIDVANGHMERLYGMAKMAKIKYGDELYLIVGNIANPLTFREYCTIGVDAVRIGIGNGNGCLTTVQTGVGYPMASLIEECRNIKNDFDCSTDIIADGGFKKYADIIKGLALGADYIMVGSLLNKALESAGPTIKTNSGDLIDHYSNDAKLMFESGIELHKTFRGMSTKEVQKNWGKDELTTSEGIVKTQKVEYTLKKWTDNLEDYLKSAMSYTNKQTLKEFIGNVTYNHITMNSFKRFDK